MIRLYSTLAILLLLQMITWAQNNNIMLNASSDSKPREVSLGLPTNTLSAVQIFEDGMPVSYFKYQLFPYKSWHGGVSANSTGKMNPMETALRYGEINTFVDSYNKTWSQVVRSSMVYTLGTFGQHKIDFNITGPIGRKGTGFSLSTYQNIDPGSNHIIYPKYKDRHQFYKATLSRNTADGEIALTYQHVDYVSISENYGPFIFVGNGDVKEADGFSLGKDSYLPEIREFYFKDCLTGELTTMNFRDGSRDKTDHLTFTLGRYLKNESPQDYIHLDIRSRYKGGTCNRGLHSIGGIETVQDDSGYSYEDGSLFTGKLQRRTLSHYATEEYTLMNNAELQIGKENSIWRIGIDYHYDNNKVVVSSANFAHEVKADPKLLYRHGQAFYNFNTSGEYYEGRENKTALYIKNSLKATDNLSLDGFIRAESNILHGHSANGEVGDKETNVRKIDYSVSNGQKTKINASYINGAIGINANYKIAHGISAMGQGVITRVGKSLFDYGGYTRPNDKPTMTKFAQGGLSYANNWVNIVSQVVYISQTNYTTRTMFQHELQKEANGNPVGFSESLTMPLQYDIQSVGWTTDAMIEAGGGFSLHLEFAIRNPLYKNFTFSPTFSDGVTEHYDFSDNNVTNLHKTEISVDPSYKLKNWKFWLSARYISKQYINRTNSLYFKSRCETFGGIDWTPNSMLACSLNVINILNQKGASGNITSADLVEDISKYKDYLMAGTFIRPFTVELSLKVNLF